MPNRSLEVMQMGLTLQDIFCQHYPDYERTHPLPLHVRKAAQAIMQCRTAALGGHIQACPEGHFSRNRSGGFRSFKINNLTS